MSKKPQADKAPMFDYYWRMFGGDLPRPKPEVNFDACIGRKHRFDWAWPEYRVAVEVDGGQYSKFGGRHSSDADREKLNIAASLRWLVFRFSPQQLERDPEGCIKMVAQAIRDSI
jgi:very-short-patch-repair endonuclease